ncbi:hypothetical protein SDC9_96974 [bioreactor metagenome]|uniref:Methyltransferase domain-containing protein n=1 Tax=bioreactor metagenome TaxID=1076179 RepID=A0A645AC06_9ZZZZ
MPPFFRIIVPFYYIFIVFSIVVLLSYREIYLICLRKHTPVLFHTMEWTVFPLENAMKGAYMRLIKEGLIRLYHMAVYLFYEKPRGLDFIRIFDAQSRLNQKVFVSSTIPKKAIKQCLEGLEIEKCDAIIDIGCGKGHALSVFSQAGFGRIHGIELIDALCEITKQNIRKLKLEGLVTVENADAEKFTAYDDFSYIYLFNPFPASVMQTVIENIEKSYRRKPRKLILIYVNPVCDDMIIRSKWIRRIEKRTVKGLRSEAEVCYYAFDPAE